MAARPWEKENRKKKQKFFDTPTRARRSEVYFCLKRPLSVFFPTATAPEVVKYDKFVGIHVLNVRPEPQATDEVPQSVSLKLRKKHISTAVQGEQILWKGAVSNETQEIIRFLSDFLAVQLLSVSASASTMGNLWTTKLLVRTQGKPRSETTFNTSGVGLLFASDH